MRLLLALAAYAAMTVACFAQAPREVPITGTIRLIPGEIKTFEFDQSVAKIDLPDEIVKVTPETDRTFTFRAMTPGTTLMTAYDPDGKLVYRGYINVSGGVVRIYGTGTPDEQKSDYVGYVCHEFGCGRADPEVDKRSGSVSITRRTRNGNIITTTKNY